ncbi:MAG: hypothetical protein IKA61_05850 [Clostridia bacterium]|nr:hypothetical protein [Clostridia bacterium]
MRAFWGKDKFEYNVELCFSATLKKGECDAVKIIAKDVYNLYVNGKFVCYGPARAGQGCARVDEIEIGELLTEEENRLSVFVQGNNTKALCFAEGSPFFGCEALKEGRVVKDASDFDCYFMADKLVRVEKMSFQRTFLEIYDMEEDRSAFSKAFIPIEKTEVESPELLTRRVSFAKNEMLYAREYERGSASANGKITWSNDFTKHQLDAGKNLYGYKRSDCEQILSYELDKIVFDDGGSLRYRAYAFSHINVGKFALSVNAKTPVTVWLIYDDLLIDGKVKFNREQIIHGAKWSLKKGRYELLTNEVYQAKYITLVFDGDAEIDGVGIIPIENPDVRPEDFTLEDAELTEIVRASVRTFRHNAYDLLTDCASRERAGYFCDGFFTARAERFFTGDNKVECNLLENYLYFKNTVYEDGGILPMCYPSAPKGSDDYIPNWMLWYIVQLEDYFRRTGDGELVKRHREQVYKTLSFFEGSENEIGLLENLEGWVFVEWSKANDFTDGVNFPSNMLYSGAIAAAGRLYGDEKLIAKAEQIKDTVRKMSFDGELFIDNAIRKDGKLVATQNISETCQNYAMFFNIFTAEENPEFYLKLNCRFGALDKNAKRMVHRSNMFIGYILRLSILYREGKYEQLLKESKEAFLPMARETGTIWEHFETHSSCNHGFGSIVGALIVKSLEKLRGGREGH